MYSQEIQTQHHQLFNKELSQQDHYTRTFNVYLMPNYRSNKLQQDHHQILIHLQLIQFVMPKKSQKVQQKHQLREGSVVLITGASSGLGKELALLLCQRKIRLIITGRDQKRLAEVADTCRSQGKADISTFLGDLSAEEKCKQLIDWTQKLYNRIDCLILNAGVNAHFEFEKVKDVAVFETLMKTNFYANVYLTKYALPMIKRGNGRIIVVSSLSGKFGLPSRSAYCASKFALTGFFQSLRTELSIPIMMVYPTSLQTPMRSHSLIKPPTQPNQKRQDPIQCAKLILTSLQSGKSDIYLPLKGWLGVVLQPIFPNFIRQRLKRAAKL